MRFFWSIIVVSVAAKQLSAALALSDSNSLFFASPQAKNDFWAAIESVNFTDFVQRAVTAII